MFPYFLLIFLLIYYLIYKIYNYNLNRYKNDNDIYLRYKNHKKINANIKNKILIINKITYIFNNLKNLIFVIIFIIFIIFIIDYIYLNNNTLDKFSFIIIIVLFFLVLLILTIHYINLFLILYNKRLNKKYLELKLKKQKILQLFFKHYFKDNENKAKLEFHNYVILKNNKIKRELKTINKQINKINNITKINLEINNKYINKYYKIKGFDWCLICVTDKNIFRAKCNYNCLSKFKKIMLN